MPSHLHPLCCAHISTPPPSLLLLRVHTSSTPSSSPQLRQRPPPSSSIVIFLQVCSTSYEIVLYVCFFFDLLSKSMENIRYKKLFIYIPTITYEYESICKVSVTYKYLHTIFFLCKPKVITYGYN